LIAFIVGAIAFLVAVLWTVFTTGEYPPEDMEEFNRKKAEGNIVSNIFKEIGEAIADMPTTMKQLAVVQFFTWFALPYMWQFYGLTVARHVFGATDDKSDLFKQGTEWGGVCFGIYNLVCFLVAFAIPPLAAKIGRKGVHIVCLTLGGLGLLSTFFATNPYFLFIGMVGIGIAWASILSMPYVILAGAIKPERMGVYMGVFNLFIVIPQVVQSFLTPQIYKSLLGDNPLNAVMFGGISMLVAAASVLIVKDVGAAKIEGVTGGGH
jgi:maltose/moltooligosaccharide transporter